MKRKFIRYQESVGLFIGEAFPELKELFTFFPHKAAPDLSLPWLWRFRLFGKGITKVAYQPAFVNAVHFNPFYAGVVNIFNILMPQHPGNFSGNK